MSQRRSLGHNQCGHEGRLVQCLLPPAATLCAVVASLPLAPTMSAPAGAVTAHERLLAALCLTRAGCIHPPLHWLDKTAIGLDKTAIGFDIEASLDKMAIGAGLELKLASLSRQDLFVPGSSFLSWDAEKTLKFILDKHGHWPSHLWLRFPFVSSRNLKFVHGPAVDKFFTRKMVRIAIRAPNPKVWPRLRYLIFETSI